MELLFLALAGGAIVAYFIFNAFSKRNSRKRTDTQSVVLLEKMKRVCKLVTVEGDFAEIYHYKSLKDKWVDYFIGRKKAIILINAKAHVGFDLNKIELTSDPEQKLVKISNFPQPEILTIDSDVKFYDKREGWANPFTSHDLTEMNREAKQHIIDKVPESGLLEQAKKEALNSILLMESLAETIGWKLDYSALAIDGEKGDIKKLH